MRFHILNVGHGFCAYAVADNGNLMMFDCGHMSHPEFRPSDYLHGQGFRSVQTLFITNYDEDHISDLPNLRRRLHVQILNRNPTTTPEQLRQLKRQAGPISPAMESLLDMMGTYTAPITDPPIFSRISWQSFYAPYGAEFQDTNNISLVIFLNCSGLNVLIPGDLEPPGWRYHLRNQEFRNRLGEVNVFVASHHGRETGYCPEVFEHCTPDVIVFSDSPVVHGTQEMANTYAAHASGVAFEGQRRYVLSTRNDGDFCWNL